MDLHDRSDTTSQLNNTPVVMDEYCWFCEKTATEFNCTTCFRSFHNECVSMNRDERHGFNCPVCRALEMSKTENNMAKQSISRALKCLMETSLNVYKFKELNAIDLNEINRKIDGKLYDSFTAFAMDIVSIGHYYSTWEKNTSIRNLIREFVKSSDVELRNITSCADCYKRMQMPVEPEWQSMACSQPHLVLWIEMNPSLNFWAAKEDYLYWPAKLVAISDDSAIVIFFKDIENKGFIEVPKSDCYIYSEKLPISIMRSLTEEYLSGMENVLQEVNFYARNIEARFGRFQIESQCVLFNEQQLEQHLRDMFPDYTGSLEITYWSDNEDESHNINSTEGDNVVLPPKDTVDDEIPNKIQRLSESIENDVETSNHLATGFNSTNDVRLNPNYEPTQGELTMRKDLREAIEDTEHVKCLAINKENENNSLVQELESLKKSHADCQAENNDLIRQLNILTHERDSAQKEVIRMKENHSEEIRALNELYKTSISYAKTTIELLEKGKRRLQVANDQKALELQSEKQHFSSELEKLKLEHERNVNELEHKVKAAIEEKANAEEQFKQMANRLEAEYESFSNSLLRD